MAIVIASVCASFGLGCRRSEAPPRDALQEAFREGELTARQSQGQRVFRQRCATCHGPTGRGDGQNAYNLRPPPPDFRESLAKLSVADRRAVIEGGTAALGRSALCPPWGRTLDGGEAEALLAFTEVMDQPSAEDEEADSPDRRRWRRRP